MSESLSIFGAGSWGTALAIHLAQSGRAVTLWARRDEHIRRLEQERANEEYLPGIEIPDSVHLTSDRETAAHSSDLWALAIPSQHVRPFLETIVPMLHSDVGLISLAKGIENETLMTMSQVIADVLPASPSNPISVLYGPSHAEEVALGRPTTVVAASPSETVAENVQSTFMTDRLRVYVNTDVIGVEIGGSAKNVLAIAAGISDGVGYGDNAKAALVTRGIAEIRRLGLAMGARASTFAGLAGIGDLVVTCMSRHSRNRALGEAIGQGKRLEEALEETHMVAEGVRTTESIHFLAKRKGIEMPITEAVYAVLFENEQPHDMMKRLMTRSAKRENWLPKALKE